jgi:4-alpha-glucanotransferase
LLHLSSLPSPWGIGDFGLPALAWIDRLASAGQRWWQFLPLGPAGRGNSPYEPFSTVALNELFISPEWLIEDGLLELADLTVPSLRDAAVDYEAVTAFKFQLLERARGKFRAGGHYDLRHVFEAFCESQRLWLDDYALFRALEQQLGGAQYQDWPAELKHRQTAALESVGRDVADAVDRYRFAQFLAHRQAQRMRDYARQKGVGLIGDVPFFVSPHSADVWAHPELFLLDADGKPLFLAGVPPDYFSAEGQLWGDPLYRWEAHRRTGYEWWIERIRSLLGRVDVARLDHFRGFAAAWHIPAGSTTAKRGEWRPGPGADFFAAVQTELGPLPVIAEDLGFITPEVLALRDEFHFPGMRVLQFAFDGDPKNPFLPENYSASVVAYTATHDNNTARGWFESLPEIERHLVRSNCHGSSIQTENVAWEFMRMVWNSVAVLAMAPLQDLLDLGGESRMNWPGRSIGNWQWRVTPQQMDSAAFDRLLELTERTGRTAGFCPSEA